MPVPNAKKRSISNLCERDILEGQEKLFQEKVEFEHVTTVIGSGYEDDIAKLAIEDGSKRAIKARMGCL